MKILFVGDVVRQAGCDFLQKQLPNLRRFYGADLTIVNGENAAEGNGILPGSAELLLDAGADIITLGNHALRRREIYPVLEESDRIIRPANFHASAPGRGWCLYDCPGKPRTAVINLQGNYLLESHENAFDCVDRLLAEIDAPVKIVDFHAEATSEKICLGLYLDGRVSAVIGTHTHIQTADERILPGGTAYITDAGMCGVFDSALGLAPEPAIRRFRTGLPTRFESCRGPVRLSGVLLEVDGKLAGYAYGAPLSDTHYDVIIEKGDRRIPDIYRILNRELVRMCCQGFTYINREEDVGVEGLRKAKLSYKPDCFIEKYLATEVPSLE